MLSRYKVMWLMVMFDLPVKTKKERKAAYVFKRDLLRDGFTMMQLSVYVRHCSDSQNAETHIRRVRDACPGTGRVSIAQITDRQYENMINIYGKKIKKNSGPQQLELF